MANDPPTPPDDSPAIQVFNLLSKSSLASAGVVPELETSKSSVSTIANGRANVPTNTPSVTTAPPNSASHDSTLVPEAPIQETPALNNTKTCTMPKLNKMRVGQAKNGHNLCAHRWLQQFKGKKAVSVVHANSSRHTGTVLAKESRGSTRTRLLHWSRRANGASTNRRKHYSSSNKTPFHFSTHVLSQLLLRFQVHCPTVSSTISRPIFKLTVPPFRARCPTIFKLTVPPFRAQFPPRFYRHSEHAVLPFSSTLSRRFEHNFLPRFYHSEGTVPPFSVYAFHVPSAYQY
ncbi:hypothetical protein BS17DRAFT_213761 [Gyrodon lividus]|nr:hypothetical protein BS17DRAFT_213761 [Gyrodon lividus]